MHRSRLSTVYIDSSEDQADAGVAFWSGALGMESAHSGDPDNPYTRLEGTADRIEVNLQRVNDTSRFHLDIETDDVEAEVERLKALGATRKEKIEEWWVMEAPSGHLFCVVPIHTDAFDQKARTWQT